MRPLPEGEGTTVGSGVHLHTIFRSVRKRTLLAEAGFPEYHIHDLRHGMASNLVRAGHSLKVVQEVLGHKTVAMSNRYSHLQVAAKRAAMESLAKFSTPNLPQPPRKES
jgi:site-specific recombinase XerD